MRFSLLPSLLLLCLAAACGGESFDGYLGKWEDPEGRRRLTIQADGAAAGHDGCNVFEGTWTGAAGAEGIAFQAGTSTLIACVDDPHHAFSDWDRAVLVDGSLEVFLEDGTRLATFQRLAQAAGSGE